MVGIRAVITKIIIGIMEEVVEEVVDITRVNSINSGIRIHKTLKTIIISNKCKVMYQVRKQILHRQEIVKIASKEDLLIELKN